jgi:hypothetical protein
MYQLFSNLQNFFPTWTIIRAAGLTAYLLLFVISACGLSMNLRLIPASYRASVIYIHKTAAQVCALFLMIHVSMLLVDPIVHFSILGLLIPGWESAFGVKLAAGIVALYSILLIVITARPFLMKLAGATTWRKAHFFALPAFWLALYHGLFIGTDRNALPIVFMYVFTGSVMLMLCGIKIGKLIYK